MALNEITQIMKEENAYSPRAAKKFMALEESLRTEEIRSGGEQGSGLGLYIVKYLAEKMGGSILLRNHAGGLEAVVSLPTEKRFEKNEFPGFLNYFLITFLLECGCQNEGGVMEDHL